MRLRDRAVLIAVTGILVSGIVDIAHTKRLNIGEIVKAVNGFVVPIEAITICEKSVHINQQLTVVNGVNLRLCQRFNAVKETLVGDVWSQDAQARHFRCRVWKLRERMRWKNDQVLAYAIKGERFSGVCYRNSDRDRLTSYKWIQSNAGDSDPRSLIQPELLNCGVKRTPGLSNGIRGFLGLTLHLLNLQFSGSSLILRGNGQIVGISATFLDFFKGSLGQFQLLTGEIIPSDVGDEHQARENSDSRIGPMGTVIGHVVLFVVCGALVFASYWFGVLQHHWLLGGVALLLSSMILWWALEIIFPI